MDSTHSLICNGRWVQCSSPSKDIFFYILFFVMSFESIFRRDFHVQI